MAGYRQHSLSQVLVYILQYLFYKSFVSDVNFIYFVYQIFFAVILVVSNIIMR